MVKQVFYFLHWKEVPVCLTSMVSLSTSLCLQHSLPYKNFGAKSVGHSYLPITYKDLSLFLKFLPGDSGLNFYKKHSTWNRVNYELINDESAKIIVGNNRINASLPYQPLILPFFLVPTGIYTSTGNDTIECCECHNSPWWSVCNSLLIRNYRCESDEKAISSTTYWLRVYRNHCATKWSMCWWLVQYW